VKLAVLAGCLALGGCTIILPHQETYAEAPAGHEILTETAPNVAVCLQRLEEKAGGKRVKLISSENQSEFLFWPGGDQRTLTCRGYAETLDQPPEATTRGRAKKHPEPESPQD
jgi:hypothetical protein